MARHGLLYGEGDAASAFYAVVSGYLRETRITGDGRLQGVRLVGPGDFVGTEAFVRPDFQSGVEAMTPARVCKVPVADVRSLMERDSGQALAFSELFCRQTVALRESVLLLGPLSAEDRVLAILRQLTAQTPHNQWFTLPLTRQEIGDFLGLALATVSRVVQRLARRGILEVRGRRIRLIDTLDDDQGPRAAEG